MVHDSCRKKWKSSFMILRKTDTHTQALGGPRKVESKRGILKKTTSCKGSDLDLGNNTWKHQ